jgi:hypothetical protein
MEIAETHYPLLVGGLRKVHTSVGRSARFAVLKGFEHGIKQRYGEREMKPLPAAPNVPGDTPAERLSNALSMVLRVSKADLLKKEARLRQAREKKRATKKRAS